jgi:transcriptional regulator with XRE-family HTH domain
LAKSIHTRRHQQLCKLLRDARKDSGLTQQQLAAKLRRPQSFVAKYELGERRLDVVEFLDVTDGITADPCDILKRLH